MNTDDPAQHFQRMAEELIRHAIAVLAHSHPRNPQNLRFGAAAKADSGEVYSSSAFWSETLTLTLHAEHATLAHAAAHGHRNIVAIACVSTEDKNEEEFCHPCGICKQLIYENSLNSGVDVLVIMANLKGKYVAKRISEMTDFPWPSHNRP